MSYNFSFADNETYGASDINKITSRLVTSGVEDAFADGVAYNLSSFNDAGTLIYTSGVVPETVFTLKVVSGSGDNTVLINPGTAFFSDGSVIEIESGGHEMEYTSGIKNYVYLKNDLISSNSSYPVCSPDVPSGDYVLLAEIEEDGTITDKRMYARGKLPGYQSNASCVMKIEDTVYFEKYTDTVTKTYDLGNNNFKFILVNNRTFSSEEGLSADRILNCVLSIYDIEKGTYISFYRMLSGGLAHNNRLDFYCSCNNATYGNAYATVTVSEGVLTLTCKLTNTNSNSNHNMRLPLNLYLF